MRGIVSNTRTVKEMLANRKYAVDFYQRGYAWQERQVRELVDDLTTRFGDFYGTEHSREDVESYGYYFLGPVITSNRDGKCYIVDGQQRLTSLTLLLVFLTRLHGKQSQRTDVESLIFSERFSKLSFNLEIPEREKVMNALYQGQAVRDDELVNESLHNLVARYRDLSDHFPEELRTKALPYFLDWLLERVQFVEIATDSEEEAYSVFETMNDRGLSLSLPEMLKGYLLANAEQKEQDALNQLWKTRLAELKTLDPEADVDFFKDWLRAQYAKTIRASAKGSKNEDAERIGSEFHRWVRDRKKELKLESPAAFKCFINPEMDFFARQALIIGQAARKVQEQDGLESIYYNADRGFTLQTQLLLAPLRSADSSEEIKRKLQLVADFLDIWLARRVWCFRTTAYASVRRTLFNLTLEIRRLPIEALSNVLKTHLHDQPERFAKNPFFRLHQQNYRQVRHILARLTHWVETQCGIPCQFETLVAEGKSRPYQVEHIWPNGHERFREHYAHPRDFDEARNRIGGLLLLQQGHNQSLGDLSYEQKRESYGHSALNLLARSLHPGAYQHAPAFQQFLQRTGLCFEPYETFGPDQQKARQELYIRLAEWVWNPARLELDHTDRAPDHDPLEWEKVRPFKSVERQKSPKSDARSASGKSLRHQERWDFWKILLEQAERYHKIGRAKPTGHAHIPFPSPLPGANFTYVVLANETRLEVYLDTRDRDSTKALFDALLSQRAAIESEFGGALDWDRLDDKRGARISLTLENGGWADRRTWALAVESSIEVMMRLRRAFDGPLDALAREPAGQV